MNPTRSQFVFHPRSAVCSVTWPLAFCGATLIGQVCTYRKSGETQRTQRLIRMSGGKVPTLPRGDVGRCGEGVGVYKM